MKILRLFLVGPLFYCCIHPCTGQQSRNVIWSTKVERISPYEGKLTITAQILPDWHLYSQHLQEGGPQPTRFEFVPSKAYRLSGFDEKGKPHTYYDELFEMDITWYSERVEFIGIVKFAEPVTTLNGTIEYMTCNAQTCVPEKKELTIHVNLTKTSR